MAKKGSRLTAESTATAEALVSDLAPLGEVTSKAMFGGHGIYCEGVMFGLVDSTGAAFLRVDDDLAAKLTAAGGSRHGRMPYVSISVDRDITAYATRALEVARAAKR